MGNYEKLANFQYLVKALMDDSYQWLRKTAKQKRRLCGQSNFAWQNGSEKPKIIRESADTPQSWWPIAARDRRCLPATLEE